MERFRSITISLSCAFMFALPALAQPSADAMLREVVSSARIGNMDGCKDLAKRFAAMPEPERKKFLAGMAKELDAAPRDIRHGFWLLSAVRELGPQGVSLAPNVVPFLFDGANTGSVSTLQAMGPGCIPAVCRALETDKKGFVPVYAAETFEAFPAAAEKPLSKLITSGNPLAAKNASWVLAHLPKLTNASAPGLAMQLANPELCGHAKEALVKAGATAVPDVLEVLGSGDTNTQIRGLEVLRLIGRPAKIAVSKVGGMLGSKDETVRRQAAATILCIAPPDSPEFVKSQNMLLKMLTDPQSSVRVLGATSLGEVGPPAAFAVLALIAAAKSEHPPAVNSFESIGMTHEVQAAAIRALAKIGDSREAAVDVLTVAAVKDQWAAEEALDSLKKMGRKAKRAVPTLVKALSVPRGPHKQELIETLTAIGPDAGAALLELRKIIADRHAAYRDEALLAIDAIDTDVNRKREEAKTLTADSQLHSQAMAMLAKYPMREKADIQILLNGLKDSNMEAKWHAIEALGNAGPAAEPAIPILLKDNLGCSFMPDQRSRAFKAIKQIDPTGAKTIPLLNKSLNDCFEVQSAVELLEYIHSPQTIQLAQVTRAKWKLK